MPVQSFDHKVEFGCNGVEQMLTSGSGVGGRRPFEDAAIGDQATGTTTRPAVEQCGAERDDDVDGAASACPGRVSPARVAIPLSGGCNVDRPPRSRSGAVAAR
jgi:hypothetical protein